MQTFLKCLILSIVLAPKVICITDSAKLELEKQTFSSLLHETESQF